MATSKIVQAAEAAKADGYKYMTSIVKTHFYTTYYNVVRIDKILATGKWEPASEVVFDSGAHGKFGVTSVPEKSINKSDAIAIYCQ